MSISRTELCVLTFLVLCLLAIAIPQCHADEAPYTQVSLGSTAWRGEAAVGQISFVEPASVLRNARWQEDITLIENFSYQGVAYPRNGIVSGMFVDGLGHFDFGLGVSAMFNPAPFNATNFNFALEVAYRFERLPITVSYRHWSNADERLPNIGRDMVLLGYRFH